MAKILNELMVLLFIDNQNHILNYSPLVDHRAFLPYL
jgi:hypothetical protein